MIKEAISNFETPIAKMLPHGAIGELAKEFGLHRLTIGKALSGHRDYDEITVAKIVAAALKLIKIEGKQGVKYAEEKETELQEILESLAA